MAHPNRCLQAGFEIGHNFRKDIRKEKGSAFLDRGKIPTPQKSRTQLIEAIDKIFDKAPSVEGIAISMPGIIDSENGYCKMGGALHYNDDIYSRFVSGKGCEAYLGALSVLKTSKANNQNSLKAIEAVFNRQMAS